MLLLGSLGGPPCAARCGWRLHPLLVAGGFDRHPGCVPDGQPWRPALETAAEEAMQVSAAQRLAEVAQEAARTRLAAQLASLPEVAARTRVTGEMARARLGPVRVPPRGLGGWPSGTVGQAANRGRRW